MALESPPPLQSNDALPPAGGGPSGPNAFDLHADQRLLTSPLARTNITDSTGAVHFPTLYASNTPGDSSAAQPAPSAPATHALKVKSGDSLWKIAVQSLNHGNRHMHVDGEQIWQRIHDIVELNRAQHPDIKANPYFIWPGEQLIVPGSADTPATAPHIARPGGATPHGPERAPDKVTAPGGVTAHGRSPERTTGSGLPPKADAAPLPDDAHLAKALTKEATHQARVIDTVGSCSQGPRQTLEHFGIKIRPMPAVAQGQLLEKSGLFDRVPADQVQPGDYGYRHWSASTIKRRGLGDLGDSFIVTNCNRKGLQAANDHMFTVPPGGGYYAPGITFLRPNAKFYAAYEHYKETGQKTHL